MGGIYSAEESECRVKHQPVLAGLGWLALELGTNFFAQPCTHYVICLSKMLTPRNGTVEDALNESTGRDSRDIHPSSILPFGAFF